MKRLIAGLITAALMISAPALATAQTRRPSAQASKPSIGLFGLFDYTTVSSPKTFDAVFGKHTTTGPGVGVDAVNLWNGLFVRVDASRSTLSGERVVVFNGDVFKLGIPLTAELTPLEFGAGWRFSLRNKRTGRVSPVTPYVGASAVSLKYKETSSFADSADNVDETYTGFGVFAGVDVRIVHQVFGGVEGQYRVINITPGPNSAAASFNEKDFGGGVLRVRLGIRF
jgi:opacity protein-like surface antigen